MKRLAELLAKLVHQGTLKHTEAQELLTEAVMVEKLAKDMLWEANFRVGNISPATKFERN